MISNSTLKQEIGQQLQVANQQITLCQQKIQQDKDCPQKQLFLQNALGAVAKAWEIVESSR
ncbi:hypothetical protein ACJDU8_22495 [Clostridium sp. WILCCON 0269]|uniref:EscE/YscE/SsaE family type III secretion system needle protein co-chaperone n=1 Tax=Candidatus Clostridium eludens TaxID=3381663 RepID=A0ABW8ST08_9CLOT